MRIAFWRTWTQRRPARSLFGGLPAAVIHHRNPTIIEERITCERYRFADVERRVGDVPPTQPVGFSALLGLGVVVAVVIAVGLGLGLLVDSLAGTGPVFLLVGLLLGIVTAVGYTISKFRTYLHTTRTTTED